MQELDISGNPQTASQSRRGFATLEQSDLDLTQQQDSSGGADAFFAKRNAARGGTPDVAMEGSDEQYEQFDPA
jgi:hypothetical protein